MASIFTYDPDPPRVSSPWSTPGRLTPRQDGVGTQSREVTEPDCPGPANQPQSPTLHDLRGQGIAKLEAEPQDGPTEYKLHLLVRPRRSFSSISTGQHVSGSNHSRLPLPPRTEIDVGVPRPLAQALPSQSRQHRLEQLTTQLLWRLQQSSPYHSSSSKNPVLPVLPEASSKLQIPPRPGRLYPGLEESKGALYEIGVTDDGTFVGLAEDEMQESLNNLRAMAASLGCTVDVLRMVAVGDCQWLEDLQHVEGIVKAMQSSKLWVAEALVKPGTSRVQQDCVLNGHGRPIPSIVSLDGASLHSEQLHEHHGTSTKPQLRASLTGATTSGKSSLLGTLSTATLDNGRGKSRLSLLKHRHEIASGMTSSVAQELIGYRDHEISQGGEALVEVINYASGNVSSWNDIHALSESGRLVFLSDSAGHPRYRRTTVRGVVGWAPHWALLCIAADANEETPGKPASKATSQDGLGSASAEVDLSKAHLDLCLKLDLPLVVIITKFDLASKLSLRQTLSKLLSSLKAAGRKPTILPNNTGSVAAETDLQYIAPSDRKDLRQVVLELQNDPLATVPILLTSAVKGTGIGKLHALLHDLPIIRPRPMTQARNNASLIPSGPTIFYIEDVYGKPVQQSIAASSSKMNAYDAACIVSGHLAAGNITVGDEVLIGPFATTVETTIDQDYTQQSTPLSRSFPGALNTGLSPKLPQHPITQPSSDHEWLPVRVASIRNLRCPTHNLVADQVGTVGIIPTTSTFPATAFSKIRKGMVLASHTPRAASSFTASFIRTHELDTLAVGNLVVVYVASVRASAKVISAALRDPPPPSNQAYNGPSSLSARRSAPSGPPTLEPFDFDGDESSEVSSAEDDEQNDGPQTIDITFRFVTGKEFVRGGDKVLVMPGGGPGLYGGNNLKGRGEKGVAGLEGFAGVVVLDEMDAG